MINNVTTNLMKKIAQLHEIPQGAHSIRKNGEVVSMNSTEHILITSKEDVEGLDIRISSECQKESLHMPVIIENEDISETVYNTFYIGGGADVTIIAGCGLHNEGNESNKSEHNGIHEFHIGKWAKVTYIETHYASGTVETSKVLNPKTIFHIEKDATVTLEMVQLGGVNKSDRDTKVILKDRAKLIISERLMTEDDQIAKSDIVVNLDGKDSSAQIVSRSVARNNSEQTYTFDLVGNNASRGHIECDAIIMDKAKVISKPVVSAFHADANLVHEAAIGKIEAEQIIKLMTLGMTEKESEETIINGFLK
ncbi:SufB/SufD family protein [Anaeromicrobium sediminis]|uniref:ABC transporter permease n=1 Tax=Anaeromicrobium sediminis TaxID=1478221 RepID=A0A267MLV5_9FIRM|nr:SufD family Fe-S cluster assembly protein [Anaeromicrobium sediminis]PAB60569.1 ABC transporter permease [Anaeromicrobium sediminis]